MVKIAQTICLQKPTNCLSVFDHFVGLALKKLRKWRNQKLIVNYIFDKTDIQKTDVYISLWNIFKIQFRWIYLDFVIDFIEEIKSHWET